MKGFKYKKQIIFEIAIVLFVCALVSLVFFLTSNNKTVETSANNNTNDIEQIIPNVNEENTKFNISDTKKKVETANISAENRLSDYNLYYCIKFDNNKNFEINNEDYLIFNDLILLVEENCSILFKYEQNGNFSTEPYTIKISNIEENKETSVKVSEKELNKEKVDKKDNTQATSPYFIKVNYGANVVTIYKKDAEGNYTVPFKAMVCSCGKYTPKSGTYKTSNKYVWRLLINNVYGQYATRIVKKILFHSVPYTASSNDALEYWEYDKLGQTASEGCIRLTVRDAKWIYNNCPSGTMVEFYSDSNPGPLGKPSAQKISSNELCRNWDPTDPAKGNPWHTYNENKDTDKKEENNNSNVETSTNNTINNSITNSIVTNNTITNNTVNNNIETNNTIIDNSSNNNTVTNNITNNTISNNTITNNIITNNTTTNNNTINNITSNNNSISNSNNSNANQNTTNSNNSNINTNNAINNNTSTKPVNNLIKNGIS